MHLFFTLQISLFQLTALLKRCCTFVMAKTFLFRIPKCMLFWKKSSAIVPGIFYTGRRQGEAHFHCSLRNWRHSASLVNSRPSWSTPCACPDLHSNTQPIRAGFREQTLSITVMIKFHAKRRVILCTTVLTNKTVNLSQVLRLTNNLFAMFHLFILKMFKRRCWIYSWHFSPVDNSLQKHDMNIQCSSLKIWTVS